MIETKHAILIDKQGYKGEFVLVEFLEEDGETKERPLGYSLRDDESLVYEDVSTVLSMHKPRWTGTAWEETATPEEIGSARLARLEEAGIFGQMEQQPMPPSNAELAERNLLLMEVATEIYEQNLALKAQNLQTMEAMAEVYELVLNSMMNEAEAK